MAKVKTQLIIEGKNNSRAAFDQVNKQIDGMNGKLATAGKALVGAFSVSALTGAVRGIANITDNYNLMNARLKLATGSQEEFNTAQTELKRIAAATQTPLESLVTLYGRISRPLKEAGRSQGDILKVTEAVATSFRVSGASAQEAENGVIQFAQALGSGALRGDEFNSVAEQAPRLMQALADSIGVPVGALKEMAKQGELTASVVTDALVSQLATLRAEAETLPETVGGAMTSLSDRWNEAVGQADVQPLIDAINNLADTISDPAIVSNLVAIAGAIARIAAVSVEAAAGVGTIGKDLGYIAARVTGNVDEISRVDKELEKLTAAANGVGILDLYMSDEAIAQKLAEFKAYRALLVEQQTGMNEEMQFLAEVAAAAAETGRQQEVDEYSKYLGDLRKLQDEQVKAAEKGAKALVAAEKKATAELSKVRDERLKIEERYREALAGLGGEGEASFGAAQALKVGARQALQAGDIAGAQSQAQGALKMLQELAAAGENTYGFEGFIKELKAIELAANDLEQTNAQAKIDEIKASIQSLEADAKSLENLNVSFKADNATIEAVRTQIQALAAELGKTQIVLPVVVGHPDGPIVQDLPPVPGFATGTTNAPPGMAWVGEDGPELVSFSGGETVFPADLSRNLAATLNGLQVSGLSDSSLVEAAMSTQAGPSFPHLGRLDINAGGQSIPAYIDLDFAKQLRRTATKLGRTRS